MNQAYLKFAKARALPHLQNGNPQLAIRTLLSDLNKHPEFCDFAPLTTAQTILPEAFNPKD